MIEDISFEYRPDPDRQLAASPGARAAPATGSRPARTTDRHAATRRAPGRCRPAPATPRGGAFRPDPRRRRAAAAPQLRHGRCRPWPPTDAAPASTRASPASRLSDATPSNSSRGSRPSRKAMAARRNRAVATRSFSTWVLASARANCSSVLRHGPAASATAAGSASGLRRGEQRQAQRGRGIPFVLLQQPHGRERVPVAQQERRGQQWEH